MCWRLPKSEYTVHRPITQRPTTNGSSNTAVNAALFNLTALIKLTGDIWMSLTEGLDRQTYLIEVVSQNYCPFCSKFSFSYFILS